MTTTFATFLTDAVGSVDLEQTAPRLGKIDHAGSFGMFWSLDFKDQVTTTLPDGSAWPSGEFVRKVKERWYG